MHDPQEMPGRLASFLGNVDGGRTATVDDYQPMIGGYSRVMARAVVELVRRDQRDGRAPRRPAGRQGDDGDRP